MLSPCDIDVVGRGCRVLGEDVVDEITYKSVAIAVADVVDDELVVAPLPFSQLQSHQHDKSSTLWRFPFAASNICKLDTAILMATSLCVASRVPVGQLDRRGRAITELVLNLGPVRGWCMSSVSTSVTGATLLMTSSSSPWRRLWRSGDECKGAALGARWFHLIVATGVGDRGRNSVGLTTVAQRRGRRWGNAGDAEWRRLTCRSHSSNGPHSGFLEIQISFELRDTCHHIFVVLWPRFGSQWHVRLRNVVQQSDMNLPFACEQSASAYKGNGQTTS